MNQPQTEQTKSKTPFTDKNEMERYCAPDDGEPNPMVVFSSDVRKIEAVKIQLEEVGQAVVDEINAVGSASLGTLERLSAALKASENLNNE